MERLLYDLGAIIYEIAKEKGYLASKEQILDYDKAKFTVYIDNSRSNELIFSISHYYSVRPGYIIDTIEHAEEIKEIFKNDAGVQAKIKEYLGGK